MSDEFWIVRDDCGVKCFPRAGSTTILHSYGYGQSRERWMLTDRKFVVVRDPYARLLSAYALLHGKRLPDSDVPKLPDMNALLEYALERKDEDRDVHVRSMTAQLQGYEPKDGEIYGLKYFLANPALNIGPRAARLHYNETGRRPETGKIDETLFAEYVKQYQSDLELWKRAKTH